MSPRSSRERPLTPELRAGATAFVCFALGFTAFFWRSLTTGNYIAPSDTLDFGLASFLSSQRFWTEGMFSGYPVAADPQALMWYPPFRALQLFASPPAWNAFMVMPYVVSATGAFLLVRRLTGSAPAGVLSAVTFGYSGIMLAHISHFNQIHAASWLPMVAYGLLLIREERWRAGVLVGSAALSLMITAGHPQVVVYTTYVAAGVMACWTWQDGPDRRSAIRRLTGTIALFSLGIALASALVLPTLELASLSPRAEADWELYSEKPLPPWQVVTLAWPLSFGGFKTPGAEVAYFGDSSPGEMTGYAGLLPLSLALVGPFLLTRRDRREAMVWSGVTLLALLLCLGPATPVGTAFFYAPGYASFRVPARHFFVMTFALSVAAGVVFAHLIVGRRRLIGLAVGITGAVALAAGGCLAIADTHMRELLLANPTYVRWAVLMPATIGLTLCAMSWLSGRSGGKANTSLVAAMFIALLIVEMTFFHYAMPGYRLSNYAEVTDEDVVPDPAISRIADDNLSSGGRILAADGSKNQFFRPNLPRAWGMRAATGTGSLPLLAYRNTLWIGGPGDIEPDALLGSDTAIDWYSVRYLVVPELWPVTASLQQEAGRWIAAGRLQYLDGGKPLYYALLKNARAFPRAWCASNTIALDADSTRQAIRSGAVGDSRYDARHVAFVDEDSRTLSAPADAEVPAVLVESVAGDERLLQVDTSRECLLVVSDPHYPWWKGTIDGSSAQIQRVNLSMLGVLVPAGHHKVHLWIEPRTVWAGLGVSGTALLAWLGLAVSGRGRSAGTAREQAA